MKGAFFSLAGLLVVVGSLFAYVWAAPPIPFTETAGAAYQGNPTLPVRDYSLFSGLEGKAEVVIQSGRNVGMARLLRVIRGKPHRIEISEPLQFDVPATEPATIALASVATPVAIFETRLPIRRFPREDSRVFAYTKPGMWKQTMRITPEWVKIEIKPEVEGWVLAADASLSEGIAPQAAFRAAHPIRRIPFDEAGRIRWEGRVVTKKRLSASDGKTVRYVVNAQNLQGEAMTFDLPEAEWRNLRETQYIALLDDKQVLSIEVPFGFTKMGPPYEVVGQDGDWVKIQLQDQGWVPKDACFLDVHYRYTITRRQSVKQLLTRVLPAGFR